MKKKLFLAVILGSLFTALIFAQEETDSSLANESEAAQTTQDISKENPADDSRNAKRRFDFVLQFEPTVYINPESTTVSAPSPIVYPLTFGLNIPLYKNFSIQPTLSFFLMYHLYYNGIAVPAEIENRTTTTLSFFLNVPLMYTLSFNRFCVQMTGGLGLLFRFGLLSSGVSESDSGYTGSAASDVEEINKWFWSGAHFLYLTTGGSILFNLTESLKAGPIIEFALPLGSLFSGEGAQGMLISFGVKVVF